MPVDADRLQPGTTIDGYVVQDLLGVGGFGTVYRCATDRGDPVALKLSAKVPGVFSTRHLIWQQNEIEVLKRLNHPSIVRLIDFNYYRGERLYLVMDLVEGELLLDYLRKNQPLEPIEAIEIARNVADALTHCHKLNILHLDLKPSNIFITDPHESKVNILDFGLAHLRGSGPASAALLRPGTVQYMAPECFDTEEQNWLGPQLDTYALGTILYEMIAGRRPFDAATAWELIKIKRADRAPALADTVPGVDRALSDLVAHLLEPRPERRLADAGVLCTRLRELYYQILRGDAHDGRRVEPAGPPTPTVSPFVGRRAELAAILERFAAVSADAGAALIVSGEGGIGKTRLVNEALSHPSLARQAITGYGRCRDLGGRVPYAPIREALEQLAHTLRSLPRKSEDARALRESLSEAIAEDADLLTELVPELRHLTMIEEASASAGSTLVGANRVAESLRRVFTALGRLHRCVIVIEDLHWADEGTRTVLRQLVTPATPPGLFILGTTRQDVQAPGVEVVRLSTLAGADHDELLQSLAGATEQALASLKQAVPLLGVGNPLLTTQVIQSMWMDGYLVQGPDGSTVVREDRIDDYRPPESITSVLQRIGERLDAGTLDVLGVASLMGRQLQLADLSGLGLFEPDAIAAALAAAERHHLCRVTRTQCAFAHDLIREYVEGTVPAAELPRIHGLIARRLMSRGVEAGTVAHHLERANQPIAAARAYLEAARDADRVHDLLGAYRSLERAIDLLVTAGDAGDAAAAAAATGAPPDRAALIRQAAYELARVGCALGSTQHLIGYLDRCAAQLDGADARAQIPLSSAYARVYYVAGDFPNAVGHSRKVLEAGGDDPEAQAYLTVPSNILGRALAASGKFGPAVKLLTDGCRLAEEVGERIELSHSKGLLSVALGYTGAFEAARQVSRACAQLARETGDPVRWLGSLLYDSARCESEFDWDQGVQHSTALLAYADERSIGGLYLYVGTVFAGRHQFHIGQLSRARVLLRNAINLSELLGITMLIGWAHAFLGDVYFVAGSLWKAEQSYRRALELGNSGAKDEYAAPLALIGLAHTAAHVAPDARQIRQYAEEAVARLAAVDNHSALAHTYLRWAEALDVIGDKQGAADARERHAEVARRLAIPIPGWWPRIPAGGGLPRRDAAASRPVADHWQGNWKTTELQLRARVDGPEPLPPVTQDSAPDETLRLFDRLATLDGYVPPYAAGAPA